VAAHQRQGAWDEIQRREGEIQANQAAANREIEAAVTRFAKERPDFEKYVPAMIGHLVESGVDLSDARAIPPALNTFYEAVRHTDPDAQPERLRDGSWRTSAAWERQEQVRLLNAGRGPKNEAEIVRMEALAPEGISYDRRKHAWVAEPVMLPVDQIVEAAAPSMTMDEWGKAEAARMMAAWKAPSVAEQLRPGSAARREAEYEAAKAKAEAERPGRPTGNAYWDYVAGFS